MARLAGGAGFVKALLEAMKPSGTTDAVLRFGPDLFFAGMAGAMAPEGTPLGQRALIGLEDGAIGLGGSLLLGGGARAAARKLQQTRMPDLSDARIDQIGMAGDMLAMPVNVLAPRPAFQHALEQAFESQGAQQRFEQDQQEDRQSQQLLAVLLQGSGLVI